LSGLQPVELTAGEAAARVHGDLEAAVLALEAADLDSALDAYVRALGLALQLGPAPAEAVLRAVLDGARLLANQGRAEGLATLGPALVGLVDQVREAGALPATPVMEAWASVTTEIGALLGQWGLVLSLPAEHRQGLQAQLQNRAALLDAATGGLFDLKKPPGWPGI
jgi:hypothetical protein